MGDERNISLSPKRKEWKVGGYTLVEVVLSMVVLGISAVSAIPAFIDVGSVRAESAVSKLVSDLAYVRQLARSRSATYGIRFDVANNSYSAFSVNLANGATTPITDPTTQAPMTVDFDTLAGMEGVTIQNPSFAGSTSILFSSRGYPQDVTTTDLVAAGSVRLSFSGTTHTIVVQPVTGEVSEQ